MSPPAFHQSHQSVPSNFLCHMKLSRLFAAAGLTLLAGCNSLDSPFSDWKVLQTGKDSRAYNPQTGEYEWPDKSGKPRPPASSTAPRTRSGATPAPATDGRPYDATKNEFRDPPIN
jgi:hypothetical protein